MSVQIPPSWVLAQRGAEIVEFLQLLGAAYAQARPKGLSISSWYRTQAETDALRSAQGSDVTGVSQHGLGLAFDLTGDTESFGAAAAALGLVVVPEGTHLHVQRYARGVVT